MWLFHWWILQLVLCFLLYNKILSFCTMTFWQIICVLTDGLEAGRFSVKFSIFFHCGLFVMGRFFNLLLADVLVRVDGHLSSKKIKVDFLSLVAAKNWHFSYFSFIRVTKTAKSMITVSFKAINSYWFKKEILNLYAKEKYTH